MNPYGGTAFGRMVLGTTPELELRYLQPVSADLAYFVEPSMGYKADLLDVYVESIQNEPVSEYQKRDIWATLAAGRLLWNGAGEIRFGITYESGELNFRSGIDLEQYGLDLEDYEDGFYFAQIGWDTLDDLGFPTSGYRWDIKSERHERELNADSNFTRVEVEGKLDR